MSTFTIDSDNNITAHAGLPAGADESQSFSSAKELAKLTAEWPASRPGRYLEQLRRRRAVRRSEAGQEIHGPQGGGRADLGGGPASVPRRCATGDRRRVRQGEGEEVPDQGQPARPGAEGRNGAA